MNKSQNLLMLAFSSSLDTSAYKEVYCTRSGGSSTQASTSAWTTAFFQNKIHWNFINIFNKNLTKLIFSEGPDGGFLMTSKTAHWALRTPCEFVTFTFSLPAFVKSMYSSSGLIELLLTSMYTSVKKKVWIYWYCSWKRVQITDQNQLERHPL